MADDPDSLHKYNQMRDFTRTSEPKGVRIKKKGFRYLIQKHAARRLHYDFRLELDGVLKSWAVTRGPSLNPSDKRLAVEVEDHPVGYGDFEGTIPQGQYGGGTVMLWDEGWWEPEGDPREGLKKGELKFILHGKRLGGSWVLVRMKPRPQDKGRNNWLLIKHEDASARDDDAEAWLDEEASSIKTGRSMDDIAAARDRVWQSDGAKVSNKQSNKTADAKTARKMALAFVPPELATLIEDAPTGEDWVHEVKFDGYRIQALLEDGRVRLLTRTGLDWTDRFGNLASFMTSLKAESAILDGEVVALDAEGRSSFSVLQAVLSESKPAPLQYYVFDLLHLDGQDLKSLPLLERKAHLEPLIKPLEDGGRILYSAHFNDPDLFQHLCGMGFEGLISKRADARYSSGRNRHWMKTKCLKRQEFVIGGFTEPTHAARGVGALLIGYYDKGAFIFAGKVGTGFDARTSADLRKKLEVLKQHDNPFISIPGDVARKAHWVAPDIVCEIAYTEWTDEGRLRHPSFQGLREDKPAAGVTRDHPVKTAALETAAPKEAAGHARRMPRTVMDKPARKSARKKGADAEIGGIRISHPDRVVFPEKGITKQALAEYYHSMAVHILPHVAGRPLSMLRCPEGIGDTCFFQRHLNADIPAVLDTGIPVKGRQDDYVMIEEATGLVSLVQWGVIELHPWGCLADKPDLPDKIIFDLDPAPGVTFDDLVAGALEVRGRMDEFGLQSFLKTTGGKGLHVVVPLERKYGWPVIKAFARAIAQSLEDDDPEYFIAKASKAAREGRIFVDYLRNDLTATAVAPYAVRARPEAGVATPLFWEELTPSLKLADLNFFTIRDRLAGQKTGPWAELAKVRQQLKAEWLEVLRIDAD